ncbi:acyl-CoA thioesterase [Xaviernesmea oryzae]|uniref:acyl-CoA thioesterase n=1 Tax=Rhizobium/Agrobacterium group TaxID=227290 RepID=UPI001F37265C|nr:thioesterase family protein [Xaviernesmea oryzae]
MAKDAVKSQEFRVPFRDVDMHGEMSRSAYVVRAEEAVTEFWRRRKPQKGDPFFTIGKITCTFHTALRLGDLVHMHVGVSKIGGKSAGFLVHMLRDGEAVAEAEIVWTAHDPVSREPVALPEDLRDWFYQYLD